MILQPIFFYLFSAVTVAAAFMVIAAKNPVHSVLFLILAFFNAAGLFILLGAEFLAMILVVVYVGAVAVLFLFVVMMLDVDFAELRAGLPAIPADRRAGRHHPAGRAGPGARRRADLAGDGGKRGRADAAARPSVTTSRAIGELLYTRYIFFFQMAGLVLLVAMIGAIVLTLRHKVGDQAAGHRAAGRADAGDGGRGRASVESGQGLGA